MDDENGNRKKLPHCHTDDKHRTLGVMLSPDDNNTAQVVRTRKVVSYFVEKIRTRFIKDHDVLHALHIPVMRLLNWPLPVITSSEDECNQIMTPVIQNILAKLQVVQSIKQDVIYGPIHLQGMSIKNVYTLVGATCISLLVQFYSTDTDIVRLLKITLN